MKLFNHKSNMRHSPVGIAVHSGLSRMVSPRPLSMLSTASGLSELLRLLLSVNPAGWGSVWMSFRADMPMLFVLLSRFWVQQPGLGANVQVDQALERKGGVARRISLFF